MLTALSRYAPLWAVSLLTLWAVPVHAQTPFGADLGPMLAHARAQHPEVIAATLETDALAARASVADSLPDPTFNVLFEDNTRGRGLGPNRIGSRTYMVEQSFPLGGKRELRRAIADSDRDEAGARRQALAEDLVLRLKMVQTQRHAAQASLRLLQGQHSLLQQIIAASDRAYAQGRIGQDAPLNARLNLSRHEVDIARAEGEATRLDARLAALLGLEGRSALRPPSGFMPVPPSSELNAESLLVLARERNPDLVQQETRIGRGEQQSRLANAEWVPDVRLGLGVKEEDLGLRSYEGLVSFNIPLRWGLRDARKSEAAAETSAARAKRSALELELTGRLQEALTMLIAQRRIEALLTQQALPQARATAEALLRSLEQGSSQIAEVLTAQLRLREVELERLKAQAEQRLALAEIERVVGGEL
jgi:cobalt-zinc-cadmium efflux system outer membrane protein